MGLTLAIEGEFEDASDLVEALITIANQLTDGYVSGYCPNHWELR